MPSPDATAKAALDDQVVQPVFFAFLDFVGAPMRATTYGAAVTLSGTGDSELDGTYDCVDPQFVSIGEPTFQQGGSDTLTVSLSGIVTIDTDTLAIIGDRSKWWMRVLRLWMRVHDESGAQQGAIIPFYTGYMVSARIIPSPDRQTIEIGTENYLVLLRQASHRNYLNQADYDSGDLSAGATIGAANGGRTGPASGIGTGSSAYLDNVDGILS